MAFRTSRRLGVPALARMMESGRVLPMVKDFANLPQLLPHGTPTLLGIHYTLESRVLQSLKPLNHRPMRSILRLANVGTSSLVWTQSLHVLGEREESLAATAVGKLVLVDRGTRRPIPFPGWFREKNRELLGTGKDLQLPPIPELPEHAFRKTFTVHHSDLDWNQHTNNSVYLRLCLDTAAAAIAAEALPGFHGDICLYPLEEMAVQYRQESFAGDSLTVHLWEGAGGAGRLAFLITKGDQRAPAFFSDMRFSLQQYPAYSRL